MGKEVTLYNYLNDEEADELVGDLYRHGINATIKAMNTDGSNCYHVIIVQSDLEQASRLAEGFRSRLKLRRERELYTCSRCKSRSVVLDRKLFSWWRKLMTRGLTVIQCSRCGYVWYA